MVEADGNTIVARRWAKFPATLFFSNLFLWLLETMFNFNMEQVGQQSETGVGALGLFIDFAVIPLGSVVIALGMLFVQRWALMLGPLLGLYPLVSLSISKAARIQTKFAEYRSGGLEASFGDGVMTALLLLALWAIFGVMLIHLRKSLAALNKSREWFARPRKPDAEALPESAANSEASSDDATNEGFCPMFPAAGQNDEIN